MSQRRVLVTGGSGFLGRAVTTALRRRGAVAFPIGRSSVDLTDERQAMRFLDKVVNEIEIVVHCAALCGGIGANMRTPLAMAITNVRMAANIVEWCSWHGKPLVAVGTVCSYPKLCAVPFRERDLWSGYPEETNAPYGNAKRMLLEMITAAKRQKNWPTRFLLPANLYGPGDDFGDESSHVIPALIKRFSAVGEGSVTCWGSGAATREFLYVDDAAEAIAIAAETVYYDAPPVMNLGSGEEVSIRDLAAKIAALCGFSGTTSWDRSKPDGQPRRLLDSSLAHAALGWRAKTSLDEGLTRTIAWWRS